MKKSIFLLFLTLLMAGGAAAQSKSWLAALASSTVVASHEPASGLELNGVETAPGNMDVLNNMYRGNTFAMVCDDRANATSLVISLDYVEGEADNYSVAGGSWTLMVYEDGNYVGSIFGDIPDGVIVDTVDESTGDTMQRMVKAHFRITGGTGRFENTEAEETPGAIYTALTDYSDEKHTTAALHNIL